MPIIYSLPNEGVVYHKITDFRMYRSSHNSNYMLDKRMLRTVMLIGYHRNEWLERISDVNHFANNVSCKISIRYTHVYHSVACERMQL